MVDWLPWNHTFGSNHNFGLVLYNGGSLYIDDGKPMPGAIAATVRNLRDVAPTIYFNVPKGYEMLVPYLDADPALREKFFSRLKVHVLRRRRLGAARRATRSRSLRSRPPASASSSSPASARPKPRRRRSLVPGNPSAPAISACRRRASN